MLLHCVDEGIELSPIRRRKWRPPPRPGSKDDPGRRGRARCLPGTGLRGEDATLRASELLVTDGPFAETKEQIGGYDVIERADLDEAIAVASRHPVAGIGTIEVRPLKQRANDL